MWGECEFSWLPEVMRLGVPQVMLVPLLRQVDVVRACFPVALCIHMGETISQGMFSFRESFELNTSVMTSGRS